MSTHLPHGWKHGPVPAGTYNWGAVVTKDCLSPAGQPGAIKFAGFNGDHAVLSDGSRIDASDVILFNNSIEIPSQYKHEPAANAASA